ncbi:MAG: hypothetical protein ACOCZL_00520 [Bacteroidota bacterium]
MKNQIIICFLTGFFLFGCKNKENTDNNDIDALLSQNMDENELSISEESMHEIIQSLPSPLEISTLIKESGSRFNQDLLNPVENADLYSFDTEKAMAMGIYAGDLGYINIYEKGHVAVSYLRTIKNLADDLKVGHFFDFETIKRIASNSRKLDSLLYISTMSFEKMDRYLREQKRSKLSVLIVTGTWIESLYLASSVVSEKPNKDLIERIGEQKMILDQIMLILSAYEDDEYFSRVLNGMYDLKEEYDKVQIEYHYKEPETQEINGRLVIIDNSYTEVVIGEEQLVKIGEVVEDIREKLLHTI